MSTQKRGMLTESMTSAMTSACLRSSDTLRHILTDSFISVSVCGETNLRSQVVWVRVKKKLIGSDSDPDLNGSDEFIGSDWIFSLKKNRPEKLINTPIKLIRQRRQISIYLRTKKKKYWLKKYKIVWKYFKRATTG
jgi:hypothetical protein